MAKRKGMEWFDYLAIILLIIGGLNWGLVGLMDFNLVTFIFGVGLITQLIYTSVFVSAIYSAWWLWMGNR